MLLGVDGITSPDEAAKLAAEANGILLEDLSSAKTDDAAPRKWRRNIARPRDICSICQEVPVQYGLLNKCDHFAQTGCIRLWRQEGNQQHEYNVRRDPEKVDSTKHCPMCRKRSEFVIPSSVVPIPIRQEKDDLGNIISVNPEKDKLIANYVQHRKQIRCKFFEKSVRHWREMNKHVEETGDRWWLPEDEDRYAFKPRCRFGNDCHYLHIDPKTGEPYIFPDSDLQYLRHSAYRIPLGGDTGIPDRVVLENIARYERDRDEDARHVIERVNLSRSGLRRPELEVRGYEPPGWEIVEPVQPIVAVDPDSEESQFQPLDFGYFHRIR
ncbi:hypothetical protein KEM55_007261 [Ascosphaera atra]|nr:hypothetical protein KEM55_007261 [Ascosphaera atra]